MTPLVINLLPNNFSSNVFTGAADTKGRDYKHAIEMAKMLKEQLKPSTLNIILITFKGTDRRFDLDTLALLNLYQVRVTYISEKISKVDISAFFKLSAKLSISKS